MKVSIQKKTRMILFATRRISIFLGAILTVLLTALAIFSILKWNSAVYLMFGFSFIIVLIAAFSFFYLFQKFDLWELLIAGTFSLMLFALLVTLAVVYPNIGINGIDFVIVIPLIGIYLSLNHLYSKEEKRLNA